MYMEMLIGRVEIMEIVVNTEPDPYAVEDIVDVKYVDMMDSAKHTGTAIPRVVVGVEGVPQLARSHLCSNPGQTWL